MKSANGLTYSGRMSARSREEMACLFRGCDCRFTLAVLAGCSAIRTLWGCSSLLQQFRGHLYWARRYE